MTREKWAAMSDDERRIKIAELCGWTFITRCGTPPRLRGNSPRVGEGLKKRGAFIPDYCNDLNAMHEAEQILNHRQSIDYDYILTDICESDDGTIKGESDVIRASAARRAEAFALTMEPET